MKIKLTLIILIVISLNSLAQTGGNNTYSFLELPTSARVSALGGYNNSLYDNDLNLVYYNPALLDAEMHNQMALNYMNYVADINLGYASYAYDLDDIGTVAAGLHYINYGNFILADQNGTINGNFYANEYSFNLYYSRKLTKDSVLTGGASLKTIYSALERYTSFGMAIDAGLNYQHPESDLSISFVIQNLGIQLKKYSGNEREPLPLDIGTGVSYKPEHAPFRISVGLHNLTNWNMRYDSPIEPGNLVEDEDNNESFTNKMGIAGDEFMRHIVLGAELVPSDNFFLAFGYNYQRRTELSLSNRPGMVGFSAGAGFKISKFMLSYGMGRYHMGGTTHTISLSTDLDEFVRN